ncbi:hypothetical protein Tco_0698839, partial [Tanacetum coccineum]
MSVSKKKAPTTTKKSKGIDLLSEAALLKEAQLKKVLKRSRRETTIHQEGGSSDGASFKPEVPDEPKGKSVDTHEGTRLKPGVLDVSKIDSFESDYESSVTPPNRVTSDLASGGVTSLNISSTKHKERPLM